MNKGKPCERHLQRKETINLAKVQANKVFIKRMKRNCCLLKYDKNFLDIDSVNKYTTELFHNTNIIYKTASVVINTTTIDDK